MIQHQQQQQQQQQLDKKKNTCFVFLVELFFGKDITLPRLEFKFH